MDDDASNDDIAARLIAELAGEAEFIDGGGFTIDPEAARRKLADRQLADPDAWVLLVVEEPRDVEAVERAGCFDGRYHVLMGAWNPADGTEGHHLSIGRLVERARAERPAEIVLGTDPDAEGEATALFVLEALDSAGYQGRVSRLARGLPAGSALEYLHRGVLEDALDGRVLLRKP